MDKAEFFNRMIADSESTKKRLFLSAINLFSAKGYANVGIRELCRSINIKESAFYNHYRSKEELFGAILDHFLEISGEADFREEEINGIIQEGNIEQFLKMSVKSYIDAIANPLYGTLLQIILMESYTNAAAYKLASVDDYTPYLAQLLHGMMDRGSIKKIDAAKAAASYYYGLKGIVQEYLIANAWCDNNDDVIKKINDHMAFFIEILKG